MRREWGFRLVSVGGAAAMTAVAVAVTNLSAVHAAWARVTYVGRPAPEPLAAGELEFAIATTVAVVLVALWPLFKPQPRRLLDTIVLTQQRVVLAMIGLAALGYFNYTYRLPRTTLMLTTLVLFVALPAFTVALRRRPESTTRAIIVGDDPLAMESLLAAARTPVLGYVSPPSAYAPEGVEAEPIRITDGGVEETSLDALPCLGGLTQFEDVLVKYDVDTVMLAFSAIDRGGFFGTLERCHDHGVRVLVHADHADHVLTGGGVGTDLLEVDLEPWDWQDRVLKRVFDIVFAGTALVVLTPVIVVISVAIKLDDGGPLFYHQERTAAFGSTFTVSKFRTMTPAAENPDPESEEEDRVTRVGRFLRRTHLDEIPQLGAILLGQMSVVGPRATWTTEEVHLEARALEWHKRWFIKPGLTGLAQIRDATSADPEAKLRADLEYIRRQSLSFDVKIVLRQLWSVVTDVIEVVGKPEEDGEPAVEVSDEAEGIEEEPERDRVVGKAQD